MDFDQRHKVHLVLVRLYLDYSVWFWAPQYKRDMKLSLLETAQLRATKLTKYLELVSYEKRLRELGLLRLEKRRLRDILTYLMEASSEDRTRLFSMVPIRNISTVSFQMQERVNQRSCIVSILGDT